MLRVVVGRLGRPHGIRGEVTVEVRTDEPELRFATGSTLFVEGTSQSFRIENAREHSGVLLLKMQGIENRNQAEELRGLILEAEVDEFALPEADDEFYDRQLVGLQVFEGQVNVGTVGDILHLPGQDVLSIALLDGREMLLPFTQEFVPEIDVKAQRINIVPPQGLMDDANAH